MKLKSLKIEMGNSWDENAGKYVGKIEYEGKSGAVVMQLDPSMSNALLVCIGGVITKFAAEAANEVSKNIFQSLEEAGKPTIQIESGK